MAKKTVFTVMVITLLVSTPTSVVEGWGNPSGQHVYSKGAVATDAGRCSEIGRDMLMRGGSAVDATIAAALCIGIVNSHSMGIGGGNVFTIYDSKTGKVEVIEAKETAPRDTSVDMFRDHVKFPDCGGLIVSTPGELRGYELAHKRHGKLPWRDLFQPSIRLAEEGFPVGRALTDALLEYRPLVLNVTTMCEVFCGKDGDILKENDTIVYPKLAQTYKTIAEEGAGAFYEGELAQRLVADIQAAGGIITTDDLRNYKATLDENPIKVDVGEYNMFVPNAPSNGPLLALMLNILRGFNFTTDSVSSIDKKILTYHRIMETFRFAHARRSMIADPKFDNNTDANVKKMISRAFADQLRAKITDHTTHPPEYYEPGYQTSDSGTSHISVLAEDGSAVSFTSTINLKLGAKLISRSTGVLLNNILRSFGFPHLEQLGMTPPPNSYIAPGKRPVSSSSPAILFDKNNKVKMVIGASGARRIPNAMTQVILNTLFFNYTLEEAVKHPRIHYETTPKGAAVELDFDTTILAGLAPKNHKFLYTNTPVGIVQAVVRQADGIHAQSDPRKFSYAAGY